MDGFSHFDHSHDQVCYIVILVTEILYSCGSLLSSATPDVGLGSSHECRPIIYIGIRVMSADSATEFDSRQAVPVLTGPLIRTSQVDTFTEALI